MRVRDVVSFFAFGAIVVFVLGYLGSLGVRIHPPRERTNLSMNVSDINGLVVGSNVLLRGVPVGKVRKIDATVNSASVDFYVDSRYPIPVDSEIRLESLSALGESYIGLRPRTDRGPMLQDGQRIATEAVTQPASISELATSVVRVLNQLEPGALERIIGEVDTALPEPLTVLPNLARAGTLLRNTASEKRGEGRELLDNFQTLLRNAGFVGPVLDNLGPPVVELAKGVQGQWRHLPILFDRGEPRNIHDFHHFLNRIQNFLDDRGPDLKVLGDAALPKLNAISGALMNFDTGQLLGNVLDAVPPDGVITLRVIPQG
jgi:phospholipid/cholesterol/gamma-HCH transport system substrate-binding protein